LICIDVSATFPNPRAQNCESIPGDPFASDSADSIFVFKPSSRLLCKNGLITGSAIYGSVETVWKIIKKRIHFKGVNNYQSAIDAICY
jgi:hypothetical protein